MRQIVLVIGLAILLIGCGDPPTPEERATRTAERATAEVVRAEERATRTAQRAQARATADAKEAREQATKTAQRAQARATADAKEAREQATKTAQRAQARATAEVIEAEKRRKGLHCLSEWDGHNEWLEREMKRGDYLSDPDSFKARETRIGALTNGEHYIKMRFTHKNAFGGTVTNTVNAFVDHETCRVTRVVGIE